MNLLKNKLFLLALVAMLAMGMGAFVVACSSGDDADDDDNDDVTYTCDGVADGMVNTCGITLLDLEGTQQDVAGLTAWCEASEEFMAAKLASPFWTCIGDAVFVDFCDEASFDACLAPADPGSGCGSAVHGIYACGVVWTFTDTTFWIPEMDMQAACGSLTDWPWSCYADCVSNTTCSDPPTQAEANAMIACLNACDAK